MITEAKAVAIDEPPIPRVSRWVVVVVVVSFVGVMVFDVLSSYWGFVLSIASFIFGAGMGAAVILLEHRRTVLAFLATCGICLVALRIAAIPGGLSGLVELILVIPFGIGWMALLVTCSAVEILWRVRRERGPARGVMWGTWSMAAVAVTASVVALAVPRSLGFATHLSLLERHVSNAPEPGSSAPLGWVGIYHVDAYATDRRGGVYFRLNQGHDGAIDRMSYGVAWKPNDKGSPFGNKSYTVTHIRDDWYTFHASNDW